MTKESSNGGGRRRKNPSLFGPIVLIAIGVYFLLQNLGALPEPGWNWGAVFQLWPLWLIFIGVNIIVRQAPRPLGTILSGVVGLAAVGVFGYVLLFGEDNAVLDRLGFANITMELQSETISYAPDDVSSANINLDFGFAGARLYTLEDSRDLIAGEVSYVGDLLFNTGVDGGQASVTLRPESGLSWLWPFNWVDFDSQWDLGLNPGVATDLRIDMGAGAANMNLEELNLSYFELDGSAGSVELHLPGGNYNVEHDASAGSSRVWVGDSGRQSFEIDGSAGSIQLYIPAGMEARIEVDDGAGSFSIDERFTQVSGSDRDEGVWETADFEDASDRVDIFIDIGAGSVRVRQP